MTYVDGPVRISVPATSANLGPGFDALGLALGMRDVLTAEVTDSDVLTITVEGAGAGDVPLDETHLVVRALTETLAELGLTRPGLRLHCHNVVPHARGLGSSAAAIVAGVALARALVVDGTDRLDDLAAFRLASRIEGHPDNVAPALFGGFTISGLLTDYWTTRLPVDERISAVVFVPPDAVSTKTARGLLPAQVSHADAAGNAGYAALLVAALTGQPEWLFTATNDFLHQSHREPAMPATLALIGELRADGVPAVVSGAGPTVLAFVTGDPNDVLGRAPSGWAVHHLPVGTEGVRSEPV